MIASSNAGAAKWLAYQINFYLFFYKQIRLKCVFLNIVAILTANNMKKSLKNFKIFSVTVVLYGAGQMGS